MPGSIRLFVQTPLAPGVEIAATPGQAHYLGTVMRRMEGATVLLFNGEDGEWRARLTGIRRARASLLVETRLRPQATEPDFWLAFAPLRRELTELVVQKATELGVSAILPVFTERTRGERVNVARLGAIATEAAEQSERLTVPALEPPRRFPELLANWSDRRLYAAVERSTARPAPTPDPAGLLVGPEGGWTPAELDALRAHPFSVLVSFGPRILRAETASIVGLALLQTSD